MANRVTTLGADGLFNGDGKKLNNAVLDVYSLDIMHNAQGVMRYEDFAVMRTDLMRVPGETVKFTTYSDIERGGAITEGVSLEGRSMQTSEVSVTVTEYGNAIKVSEKLLQLAWDDVLSEASVLLGRDYAVVRDLDIRDKLVASGSTLFADANSAGHDALGDVTAGDKLDIETLRNGIESLQTVNAPKFMDDFYVCLVHPHQAAYLRRDPDWVNAHNYARTRNLFTGEIGRWEDVVFITTTHQGNGVAGATEAGYETALDGTGHNGIDLYRATLLADQAYAVCDALPVELRDNGVEDFGRLHGLAWYGIWGCGVLKPNHIVHMISA